jgi:CRISPR/Cas system-associated exonuclease Cas4 (RecB family)
MIVDKINQYLSTTGKTVDEAILKEVSDLAAFAFQRQFGVREERDQKTPYFSSIGKCLRQQAYKLLKFEENGKEMDSRSKMVFFQGDMAELAVIQVAKQAGCNISVGGSDQESIEVDGMRGRPDGILHDAGQTQPTKEDLRDAEELGELTFEARPPQDYVVEVKSMSSFSFRDFERGVVDDGYRYQCNAAMLALKLNKTVIVGLNKDSGVLHEMVISRDEKIIEDIAERLDTLKKATKEDLPYRPYQPDAAGFYPWQCRYCAFFKTCLPNAELVLVKNAYKLKEVKKNAIPA